jgi:hypothetical protein
LPWFGSTAMMNPDRDRDAALEALLASVASAQAPTGFSARVREALDARASGSRHSRTWWPALAAVALLLVAAAGWWVWRQPDRVPARSETTTARSTVPDTLLERRSQLVADAPLARLPVPQQARLRTPLSQDHERALPALGSPPDVSQRVIAPVDLSVAPLVVRPTAALEPLMIDAVTEDGTGEKQ